MLSFFRLAQQSISSQKLRMFRQSLKVGKSTTFRWRSTVATLKSETADNSYVQQLQSEWQDAKPFKDIPGPTRWQMFRGYQKGGEFIKLDMVDLMSLLRQRYGDLFIMPGLFGMPSNLVSFNVDHFEKTYRTEGQWPVRPGSEPLIQYRERRPDGFYKDCIGLIVSGEQWGYLRSTANPVLMQHRNTVSYLEPMQRVNRKFVQRIRDIRDKQTLEVPGDFLKEINHLTFESVAVVALNRELGVIGNTDKTHKAMLLFHHLQDFITVLNELLLNPSVYKYVSTPNYRRFSRAVDGIFDVCTYYINETLDQISKKPAGSTDNMSVLEMLLQKDKKFAVVMAMDLMMAGVDTTSSALSGIMLNMAKNPEKQAKLRDEIVSKLPTPNDEFTFSEMKSLPYLRAFIKESLRLYPVVFGNLRETGADLVLNGYRVPKSTRLLMNASQLMQDERYYVRPKEFLPERWLRQQKTGGAEEKLLSDDLSPFINLPFGFGPRMCIGKRIVDLEMEITVANLVRNFNVEFNYPTEKAFKTSFVNLPVVPLKFKFTDIKY